MGKDCPSRRRNRDSVLVGIVSCRLNLPCWNNSCSSAWISGTSSCIFFSTFVSATQPESSHLQLHGKVEASPMLGVHNFIHTRGGHGTHALGCHQTHTFHTTGHTCSKRDILPATGRSKDGGLLHVSVKDKDKLQLGFIFSSPRFHLLWSNLAPFALRGDIINTVKGV